MATTVHVDTVRSARIVEERGQITAATVEYIVSGVTGYTSSADLGKAVLANASIPQYGDTYPTDANVELYQREWQANEMKDGGKVTCSYKQRNFGATNEPIVTQALGITGGTSVIQAETEVDLEGNQIVCPAPITQSDIKTKNKPQPGKVNVYFPQSTFTYTIQLDTFEPGTITETYGGKTNSANFQNSGPGTWLCMDASFSLVAIDSVTQAQTYEISFTFQKDKDGWNPLITYTDEDGNRDSRVEVFSYSSYESGHKQDGWTIPEIYEQIDFNAIFNL